MLAFCAQVMTVRGLITVEMSPLMKPARVRSARRTMDATVLRPASSSYSGTLEATIFTSASTGR